MQNAGIKKLSDLQHINEFWQRVEVSLKQFLIKKCSSSLYQFFLLMIKQFKDAQKFSTAVVKVLEIEY